MPQLFGSVYLSAGGSIFVSGVAQEDARLFRIGAPKSFATADRFTALDHLERRTFESRVPIPCPAPERARVIPEKKFSF
jgi:hypothetical protein